MSESIECTKGPWVAIKYDPFGEDENRWSVVTTGYEEKEYFIAIIENGAPGDCLETEKINAKLIAAAPEMFEVLHEIVASGAPYPDSDLESLLKTIKTRAASAIEKATGK